MNRHTPAAVVGILLTASLACSVGRNATSALDAPSVSIATLLPGQTAQVGEQVSVESTSVDADGIQRVELWVDDIKVRIDNNPGMDSPYLVSQSWQGNAPGAHVIVIKAFDAKGIQGESEPVVITLKEKDLPLNAPPGTVPDSTPTTGVSPSPTGDRTRLPPSSAGQTLTSSPTPSLPVSDITPQVMCTPPSCKAGEVYYCPEDCPGGCGTQCATPTPMMPLPSFEPTGIETHSVFKPVWERPTVKDYLGYPTEAAIVDQQYARQYFERGFLYWWDRPNAPGLIWAIEMPQPAANRGFLWSGPFEDTWNEGDPYSCDAARANPNGPIRGFGKVWCEHPEMAKRIGAARESEQGTGDTTNYGVVQFFQGGVMLYSPLDRDVWVLFEGGTWQRHPG